MAYATANKTATIPVIGRVVEIAKDATEAYQAWRVYRTTLTELQALSSRELDDLGLNRSSLRQAAYEAAYGIGN